MNVDPDGLLLHGERLTLKAFRKSARRIPAYKKILEENNVDPGTIMDIGDFRRKVPVLTKEDLFNKYELRDLCVDRSLKRMKNISTSSGSSGIFSFGLFTEKDMDEGSAAKTEVMLNHMFKIFKKKTFIINCVPMGVRVPISTPIAEICVNPDMALEIFNKLKNEFDQIIFLADVSFLKKILEDGIERGVDWKKESVHLIGGSDWLPETMREYFCHILDTDWDNPERGIMMMNMGLTELYSSLGQESLSSIRIRKAARGNEALRKDLFGDVEICPELLQYYPTQTYVESIPNKDGIHELVYSMLLKDSIAPLMRYNTKDRGTVIPYSDLRTILSKHDLIDLLPELKLPLIAMMGRSGKGVVIDDKRISSQEARGVLYRDFDLAAKTTGNFTLGTKGNKLTIDIQLKEKVSPSRDLEKRYAALFSSLHSPIVKLVPYYDFHRVMTINYERKFKHVL